MKILKYGSIAVAALLAAAIGFMSCGNAGGTLSSITVSPADPTIATGTKKQFTALATFSDGTVIDWTTAAAWSTSDATSVTIGNALGTYGLVTSLVTGTTGTFTITATDTVNNISGTAKLRVKDPISITITPANPFMASGITHQFKATATLADLSTGDTTTITQDLTTFATWTASSAGVATVSDTTGSKGLVTAGTTTGTTDIKADILTSQSTTVSGFTTLTVTDKPIASIKVSPENQTITQGAQQLFTAQGTFQDGTPTPDLTTSVTWYSSNTGVATISNAEGTKGLATAIFPGATGTTSTTIRATDPITGKSNYTTLSVTP